MINIPVFIYLPNSKGEYVRLRLIVLSWIMTCFTHQIFKYQKCRLPDLYIKDILPLLKNWIPKDKVIIKDAEKVNQVDRNVLCKS